MKTRKKILIVVSVLLIVILFSEIKEAYGLFESDYALSISKSVGKWNIFVNNVDSRTEEVIDIDNFVTDINPHVVSGKIAPGGRGYFDIAIRSEQTNVSFVYNLEFDFDSLNENIIIERIEEVNNNPIIRTGESTYSNIFSISDIQNGLVNDIRVYVKWINDEAKNEDDSIIGLLVDNKLGITANLTITQYLGEQLVPYVEQEEEMA